MSLECHPFDFFVVAHISRNNLISELFVHFDILTPTEGAIKKIYLAENLPWYQKSTLTLFDRSDSLLDNHDKKLPASVIHMEPPSDPQTI